MPDKLGEERPVENPKSVKPSAGDQVRDLPGSRAGRENQGQDFSAGRFAAIRVFGESARKSGPNPDACRC
jgi:hypothetical protein